MRRMDAKALREEDSMRTGVTSDQIAAGLRDLRIAAGDVVMVHSSLKSFGHVEGGADAVIDAFRDVLGPDGTLVMPTMGKDRGEDFNPERTPASTGLIPETFRKRPGMIRSLHPSHSVAAFGPKAKWIAEGHERTTAVGRDGPYGKLVHLNAAYTFVGTGVSPATIFHAFEEWMELPYLDYEHYVLHYKDKETGETKVYRGKKGLGGHRDFYVKPPCKAEVVLREAGLIVETKAGAATIFMFHARPAAGVILRHLQTDPALLLCDKAECEYCTQARATMSGWKPRADPEEILDSITTPFRKRGYQ